MSKKISKKDLKRPDQFQAELIKGFQWTTAHSTAVLGVVLVLLVGGTIYGLTSHFRSEKEIKIQEKYYSLEKRYNDTKAGFDQALQQQDKKDLKAPPAVPATGDLQKDYGPLVEGFEALIKEYPHSRGAQMAALNLSEIYANYKKPDEALRVLKAVESGLGSSDMLTALVLSQTGSIYADQNNCKQALEPWQKIIDNSSLSFAFDEVKLRMGICYESLNDMAKAEQLYTEVSRKDENNTDMSAARDAEKYLRLLKMKRNLSGSGS